jgi:hypothetical protein
MALKTRIMVTTFRSFRFGKGFDIQEVEIGEARISSTLGYFDGGVEIRQLLVH